MFKILEKTLRTGIRTIKYPQKPDTAPGGFRGKPELSRDKCTFCGMCVESCPVGVISLEGDILTIFYCGCIFCGRCEEVCPSDAVKLTREYETASKTKKDLREIIGR